MIVKIILRQPFCIFYCLTHNAQTGAATFYSWAVHWAIFCAIRSFTRAASSVVLRF